MLNHLVNEVNQGFLPISFLWSPFFFFWFFSFMNTVWQNVMLLVTIKDSLFYLFNTSCELECL